MNQNRDNSCNIRHFCVTDSAFLGKTNLSMTMLRSQKLRIACMEYDTRGITRSGVHMVGEFQLVTPRLNTCRHFHMVDHLTSTRKDEQRA